MNTLSSTSLILQLSVNNSSSVIEEVIDNEELKNTETFNTILV